MGIWTDADRKTRPSGRPVEMDKGLPMHGLGGTGRNSKESLR